MPKSLVPILIKPIVPAWVLVAAVAAQFAITSIRSSEEPSCFISFERLHYSTSVNERFGKNSIKLNIASECTKGQIETRLTSRIFTIRNGKEVTIYTSDPTRQLADKRNNRKAYFLDFWTECKQGSTRMYKGSAEGEVFLKNGQRISISENTGKYLPVKCESKAK